MADIEVRGYVSRPNRRESARGGFTSFTLSQRQKERDGSYTKNFYDCMYFGSQDVTDGAYVTVKGMFTTRKYTDKMGKERLGLCIKVNDEGLTVAPPFNSGGANSASGRPQEGFTPDDGAIPF